MSKILTKGLQTKISGYIGKTEGLSKPESRCLKDMVLGILKSKTVLVNQIAASLREGLKLKDVAKRLGAHYLKEGFWNGVTESHLATASPGIGQGEFMVMDGTDISKKHARFMEGLEFVRDGDTGRTGLGYNVVNINAVGPDKEVNPLYSKAYSYEVGALSSNNEIKKAVRQVGAHLPHKNCWVIDRGGDNQILKDFFATGANPFIIRLKRSTGLTYKGEGLRPGQIAGRVPFDLERTVVKTKKNKQVRRTYELAAVEVDHTIKGRAHRLWLVISRNKSHGGLTYLLVKTQKQCAMEVAAWAFKGYGLRWRIEEYHRHIKSQYGLEDIQVKTFNGLNSMLAILTCAMYIIYRGARAMHLDLLLYSGYNLLNKNRVRELVNFIYYKIGKVVSNLLMPVRSRWKMINTERPKDPGQFSLNLI